MAYVKKVKFSGKDPRYLSFETPFIDFYGACNKSPNGKYIVSWMHGGSENKGYCVLIEGKEFVLMQQIPNPRRGFVANNGTFILNDCKFIMEHYGFAEGLDTTFLVLDKNGDTIFQKKPPSLIAALGISEDGKYAAFVTAGGKGADLKNLKFIDVDMRKVLWEKETRWADFINFDILEGKLFLTLRHPKVDSPTVGFYFDGTPI